ncbi:phospholipase D [Pluteus cervinus]|uniref:Phospholipase D n=1 Tax=Pluteus cervinus TaxID=181527 RepID=A0ACD3B5K5_9AGAR|nr:phospholipase D [Pluteus cervinus]
MTDTKESTVPEQPKRRLRRAFSVPGRSDPKSTGAARWSRLRSLIPAVVHATLSQLQPPTPSAVAPPSVNITDELITGGLSTLMLRLWLERDEKGHRRIPILLHRLRIRISDSLHPMHDQKTVFRIECEYANGAARWVVYRTLRDFLSLHGHYAFSKVYNRNVEDLPDFPKTSIPYLKFLKKELRGEGKEVKQADFARLQREALEDYLIHLIRAVMFHPSANRLAGFLEISALFISLAQSGGIQHKAGYLRIDPCANGGGGFGRRSVTWRAQKESRWCAIRESYVVVLEEPGELTIWDVFLLDPEFRIERPRRYYRQGLHLLHLQDSGEHHADLLHVRDEKHKDSDGRSIAGSVKSCMSRIFHMGSRSRGNVSNAHADDASSTGSSDLSSYLSRAPSPMLDPSTNLNPLSPHDGQNPGESQVDATDVSKHIFYIVNSQMRLKLIAKNERQMLQWITALEKAAASSPFAKPNRFDSFAPIRMNVAAQWLVDGRDYFWNLSRAILLAKESIYIHDWWLSPELQMRRPEKERYRLDRLLERKAQEGVKIYIILYQEVSNRTTPTDSNYAKQRLVSLHPNVMVQRSPSHFQTGTFYWAHHEKLCVIDQAIAFMGGLDLCFGRWDTAQHVLTDDTQDTERPEIWPGKDYSNPRLSDFYELHKPNEDMYDRAKVARMPWHDVAMQVVGQPARDLARHFVERWNYLLRIKNHSRLMPFLLPPPEFKPGELGELGLTGTCEMQICRSAGPWSLGTPNTIEYSIQNAYVKAIEISEHFVYIENQFFITSTVVNDVKVENYIGDALVERIIRAHRKKTPWKCCVMIPLMPGFTFPVDHSDASAIRIILECQNRTIGRGPNSIFSRLRKAGINPNDYISFFSLRNWAKMRSDVLTTEQVYIHAKVCIVDDRLAIIGSANINERSQRGDRDSELAAVIRDTDMIPCTMAGKPFKVGRFAHTLRVRLMREHLGVDVDAMEEETMPIDPAKHDESFSQPFDDSAAQSFPGGRGIPELSGSEQPNGASDESLPEVGSQAAHTTSEADNDDASPVLRRTGSAHDLSNQLVGDKTPQEERTRYAPGGMMEFGFASSVVPTLEEQTTPALVDKVDGLPTSPQTENGDPAISGLPFPSRDDAQYSADSKPTHPDTKGLDDEDRIYNRKHSTKSAHKGWAVPVLKPVVDPAGFEDPIADAFWKDVWVASAVHNTEIYRKVFHSVPDDKITTWKQYKEFVLWHERMNKSPSDVAAYEGTGRVPSDAGDGLTAQEYSNSDNGSFDGLPRSSKDGGTTQESSTHANGEPTQPKARKAPKGTEPFERWERDEMERLLGELCGHLGKAGFPALNTKHVYSCIRQVIHPTRFLEDEDLAHNFLFNADRLLPLPIYN